MESLIIAFATALISWVLAEQKAGFAARLFTGVPLAAVSAWGGSVYTSVGSYYERQCPHAD